VTVAQFFEALQEFSGNAVVLMDNGAGLSLVAAVVVRGQGPGVRRRRISSRQSWTTGGKTMTDTQAFASMYERIGGEP
jgi:hypothetical protein